MKVNIKKKMLILCALSLFIVNGCSKEEEPPKKEEVQIVANDVYEAPTSPTQEQVIQFNELSTALKTTTADEKLAELVAVNFAYEFYTLANKSGKEDVGGLTFIPEFSRDIFKSYAIYRYYTNYQTVVSQYSQEDLPNVILHETKRVTASQLNYNQLVYEGFIVDLTLKYADSKIPQDGLKTNVSIQVINNGGIFQVIAAEDPNTNKSIQ